MPAGHLERLYTFKDFAQALAYVNKVGAVAEAEGHHPDLYLAWGKCKVEIWTHKINGLTESDFYMAAKADREFEPFRASCRVRPQRSQQCVDQLMRLHEAADERQGPGGARQHAVQLLEVSLDPTGHTLRAAQVEGHSRRLPSSERPFCPQDRRAPL